MDNGMKMAVKRCAGAAVLVMAGTGLAQQTAPEDLLPPESASPAAKAEPKAFDEAFPKTVSIPVIQGQAQADELPLVLPWSLANAKALMAVIAGIGPEGLDPADYQLEQLKQRSEEHTSELQSLMRISYAV